MARKKRKQNKQNKRNKTWQEMEDDLDRAPISEQIKMLENGLVKVTMTLGVMRAVAGRLSAASRGGVLTREEAARFQKVLDHVTDLHAGLALDWWGGKPDRELLELLHLIFAPRHAVGGRPIPLEEQLLAPRLGLPFEAVTAKLQKGQELWRYWQLIYKYVQENPDEPPGWRDHPLVRLVQSGSEQLDAETNKQVDELAQKLQESEQCRQTGKEGEAGKKLEEAAEMVRKLGTNGEGKVLADMPLQL